ncbi:TetR/AcrR family transcriptional regulator [Pontibacter sp. HJ8]
MADKRERIVAAALELFTTKGFQQTSTAAISKEANVATGTLFLYFKSKDELINALYREAKQALAVYFRQDFPEGAPIEVQLRHFWQHAIHWALEHPYHFRFLSMFSHSPFITNLTKEEAASSFQFMQNLVEEAIRAGSLRALDSDLFIALFSGQLHATLQHLTQNAGSKKKPALIEQAFQVLLKGVTPD